MTIAETNQGLLQDAPLRVTESGDLKSVEDLIHDEHLELERVLYTKSQGRVTIPYWRMFHGKRGRLIKNWLIYRLYEVDVIKSILSISNVQDFQVDDRSRIGTYSFNSISFNNGALIITCGEDCALNIDVTELDIESRDIEVRGKARVSHFLFLNSYTDRIYE